MPIDHRISSLRVNTIGSPNPMTHSLSVSESDQSTTPSPRGGGSNKSDHHAQKEMNDQWDALRERERHEAYGIPTLITPSQKWRISHIVACNKIVDKNNIDQCIVSITFALFDRYFSRGLVRSGEWSLALMTCLFLSIKINSTYNGKMLDVATISYECGSRYSIDHILDMERRICHGFDWYLNPVVPQHFIDIISPLLLNDQVNGHVGDDFLIPLEMRRELVKQSKLLCEVSVGDRNFVYVKPSSIAYAAILVAMDIMCFPVGASKWFASLPLDHDPNETNQYINRLHWLSCEEDHRPTKIFVYI